jgi:hypothetical protein
MFPPGERIEFDFHAGLILLPVPCGKQPYFTRVPRRLHADEGIFTSFFTIRGPKMAQKQVPARLLAVPAVGNEQIAISLQNGRFLPIPNCQSLAATASGAIMMKRKFRFELFYL